MAHQPRGRPFGDTTYTKIFVGGLAWETQKETMRRYFDQFGEIQEAVVIRDKATGRSKGYGFVTFKDAESAQRACQDPSPVIDGRRANCNLASLGASSHSRSRPPTPQHGFRPFRAPSPAPTAFFHQPPHYPLPFSLCGYSAGFSQDGAYPMSYYGHGQFSPYYPAAAMDLGVFHNLYPYYPQIMQYPYLPQSFGGGILSTPASVTSTAAGGTPIIGAAPSQFPRMNPDQKPFS